MSQVETSDVLHHLLHLGEVGVRFVGAAHVRLAHDLDQRRAAAIQIDVGVAVGVLEAVVDALAGVVFHVDAGDADALCFRVRLRITSTIAVLGQRLIVLRDLVALGQVRIEIVLAREDRHRVDRAVQRQRGLDGQFHGVAIQHRQRARQAQADRTHIACWAARRNWSGNRRRSWSAWRAERGLPARSPVRTW